MTAQVGALSARYWDVTVSCPRPKSRVSVRQQAWHLEPNRVQRSIRAFFPQGTSLTLTTRTVRLHVKLSSQQLGCTHSPARLEETLANLLDCLYFNTGLSGADGLPSPVRFQIVERTEETSPSKGDQVT